MIKNIIVFILFTVAVVWSFHIRNPYFLFVRSYEFIIIPIIFCLIILLSLTFKSKRYKYSILSVSFLLMLNIIVNQLIFNKNKEAILNNPSFIQKHINKRLIIGFNDFRDIKKLSLNGISGIYITKRNIKGKSLKEIQEFIAELQNKRKETGLTPLIVTTDQEGGPVSRLSPLIERQPPLNSLVERKDSYNLALEYGNKQGKLLNHIGINVNFGPVVDLKQNKPIEALDFHTQINTRAISDTAEKIIQVALPYIKGLEENNITATLKHFPGLGKVHSDTHHFSAELDASVSELIKDDWLPYITLTAKTNSWIMLSHVILSRIDNKNPVSTSKIVVDNIIRKRLGFKGILITDDLTMGATYNRGFCKSVLGAYNADIEYLLIAYDYEKYYDLINCLENV